MNKELKCATIDDLIGWLEYHKKLHGGDRKVKIATTDGRVLCGNLVSDYHYTKLTTIVEVPSVKLKEIT